MTFARRALPILAQIALLLATVQFFLAGLGVFRAKPHDGKRLFESSAFDPHRALGDGLQFFALLIVLFSLVGRYRPRLSLLLLILMILQTVLASAGKDAPAIGALHPVNGLAIIAVAHFLARRERTAEPAPST